jgi:Protein of unknown function (DUF3108)
MAPLKPLQTKHWLALLGTLFVIVLIAHLAALTLAKSQFSMQNSVKTSAFTTRMIEAPALVPVAQKPPDVVSPQNPPKASPKLVKPKPVPSRVPVLAQKSAPALSPQPVETVAAPQNPLLAPELAPPPEQPPPTPVEVVTPTPEPVQAIPTAIPTATPTPATAEAGVQPPAFTALRSGRHTYKALFTKDASTTHGKAEVLWQQNGEKYALSLTASVLMFEAIAWKSTGLMSPQGLQPERFSDKRIRRSEVAAHFDRVQNKISFSVNAPDAVLQTDAQDRISIIWQLAGLLSAEPARYPPGSSISIQTVDATEAQMWLFTVNEPETLNLDSGTQMALRLTRNPRREFDRKIELWFAPALGYLPVRLRQTQTNGETFDMLWQSFQALPNAPPR